MVSPNIVIGFYLFFIAGFKKATDKKPGHELLVRNLRKPLQSSLLRDCSTKIPVDNHLIIKQAKSVCNHSDF